MRHIHRWRDAKSNFLAAAGPSHDDGSKSSNDPVTPAQISDPYLGDKEEAYYESSKENFSPEKEEDIKIDSDYTKDCSRENDDAEQFNDFDSQQDPFIDISNTVKFAMNMGNYLNRSVVELINNREHLINQINNLLRKKISLEVEQSSLTVEEATKEYYDLMDPLYSKISDELLEIRRERSAVASELEKLLRILNSPEVALRMPNELSTRYSSVFAPILNGTNFSDQSSIYSNYNSPRKLIVSQHIQSDQDATEPQVSYKDTSSRGAKSLSESSKLRFSRNYTSKDIKSISPSNISASIGRAFGLKIRKKSVKSAVFSASPLLSGIFNERFDVFGSPLSVTLCIENSTVPNVIRRCIAEIESKGLNFEGLYRKPGSTSEINSLAKAFNDSRFLGHQVDLSTADVSTLTSLVKKYFRELPDIIPSHKMILELSQLTSPPSKVNETTIEIVRDLLQYLPPGHSDTLAVFIKHLGLVSLHFEHNLMDSANLALVISPSLFHPGSVGKVEGRDQAFPDMISATNLLVSHASAIFGNSRASSSAGGSYSESCVTTSTSRNGHMDTQFNSSSNIKRNSQFSPPLTSLYASTDHESHLSRVNISSNCLPDKDTYFDQHSSQRSKSRTSIARKRLTRPIFGK